MREHSIIFLVCTTIKEQLVERGMRQKAFAQRMYMFEKHISRLINGQVQLTPDMAMRLEIVLEYLNPLISRG